MPCYSYNDDTPQPPNDQNGAPQAPNPAERPPEPHAPLMPPAPGPQNHYLPPQAPWGPGGPGGGSFNPPPQPGFDPEKTFKSIRNFITASQIIALVSLIIGGVLLSTVSIVLALIARSRAQALCSRQNDPNLAGWVALRKSATFAAVMGAVALVLNAIALMTYYPMLLNALQGGDYSSIWGGSAPFAAPSGSGSSAW